MIYNGKEVYSEETFNYSTARAGDYVTQDVVDDAIDLLPPVCMRSSCTQMGEPYSNRVDPNSGRWRNTYATFKYVSSGIWEYCGHCFAGENVERGKDPQYF